MVLLKVFLAPFPHGARNTFLRKKSKAFKMDIIFSIVSIDLTVVP